MHFIVIHFKDRYFNIQTNHRIFYIQLFYRLYIVRYIIDMHFHRQNFYKQMLYSRLFRTQFIQISKRKGKFLVITPYTLFCRYFSTESTKTLKWRKYNIEEKDQRKISPFSRSCSHNSWDPQIHKTRRGHSFPSARGGRCYT